jgi:hypothetical protein
MDRPVKAAFLEIWQKAAWKARRDGAQQRIQGGESGGLIWLHQGDIHFYFWMSSKNWVSFEFIRDIHKFVA